MLIKTILVLILLSGVCVNEMNDEFQYIHGIELTPYFNLVGSIVWWFEIFICNLRFLSFNGTVGIILINFFFVLWRKV